MMIEAGSRIALDTNVLLDATDEGRELHGLAMAVWDLLPARGVKIFVGTQVYREYLVVATRPASGNGLGMLVTDAVANVGRFRERAHLVAESPEAGDLLLAWAVEFGVTGRKLHDLQILASTHAAEIETLVTSNAGDFPAQAGPKIISLHELFGD